MTENYKSHDIGTTAWQVLETKQWKPTVLITGPGMESFCQERYIFDVAFSDEPSAEAAGMEWAKRLIDERRR